MKSKVIDLIFKIGILIVIFFLFPNCKKEIDMTGVWVGTYIIKGDTLSEQPSVRPIVDLTEDHIFYRTIGYEAGIFEKVDSFTTKYNWKYDRIYLKNINKEVVVDRYKEDSVIAYFLDKPKFKMVFNKIDQGIPSDQLVLKKREFIFKGIDNTEHSLYFANDSLLFQYHQKSNSFDLHKWKLISFRNHSFLFMHNDVMSSSLHLDSISGDKISFSRYSRSRSFPFTEQIKFDSIKKNLLGIWHLHSRIDSKSYQGLNSKILGKVTSLNFKENQIDFKNNNEIFSKRYELRGFGKLLIFPEEIVSKSEVLKIEQMHSDTLVLVEFGQSGEVLLKHKFVR